MSLESTVSSFAFVREWHDEFLTLFPHRGDYLWATHPDPGQKPTWKTESRHLLSDRLIAQGRHLYGVRFGQATQYLLIDIDIGSPYHPCHDEFAIRRILNALEPLGITTAVAIQSSDRQGIHLYLPLSEPHTCWAIALAVATLIENVGYSLKSGQVELYPNPKPFSSSCTLYGGHRLPLQRGSYLLNADWQPMFTTPAAFVRQWRCAQVKNEVDPQVLKQVLATCPRKHLGLRSKGEKYLNDLNTDIEPGWTATGQTNFLLGKIANRERVFHHVVWGGEPLSSGALVETIVQTARSLPGFTQYCRHQTDLEVRATQWAKAAEQRYYPYGSKFITRSSATAVPADRPTWNQQQSQSAQQRITGAIAQMLQQNCLPAQATSRYRALKTFGIGSTTLDKYQHLWHPNHLQACSIDHRELLPPPLESHPSDAETADRDRLNSAVGEQSHTTKTNKLALESTSVDRDWWQEIEPPSLAAAAWQWLEVASSFGCVDWLAFISLPPNYRPEDLHWWIFDDAIALMCNEDESNENAVRLDVAMQEIPIEAWQRVRSQPSPTQAIATDSIALTSGIAQAKNDFVARLIQQGLDPYRYGRCRQCDQPIRIPGLDHNLCAGECGWVVDLEWFAWYYSGERRAT
ncbi:hypothetical protein H6F67_25685 [Microcoleus sp. FACHB-1515]|uniref:hypothetical protein n=1 Tax=Cyanophyceae TaxID=3028117 RepID=UPI00168984AD|nr:hypothetical protein [Microcoleus sp. FACHB-1515]MBD2093240.1 hypothetical protein [Microcoleus sp. FACHB-1515]